MGYDILLPAPYAVTWVHYHMTNRYDCQNFNCTYRSYRCRKTELSLRIAEYFKTSIISSDSRQLYAELKIGTAAPTPEQLKRVPHYFVGTLQLTDYYSAAQYETEVMSVLEQLFQQHHVVLLTGGSMMYVDAICKGIDDIPTVDAETRELLLHKYDTEGLDNLCAELKLLDPEYYKIVDLKIPNGSFTPWRSVT